MAITDTGLRKGLMENPEEICQKYNIPVSFDLPSATVIEYPPMMQGGYRP